MTLKIFLGNAPWRKPGFYGVRAGSRWPHFESNESEYMPFPFFLAYSSALLKREGFSVDIVDGVAERLTPENFLQKIEECAPDLLVLEVSTISIEVDLECARTARQLLSPHSKIVLCGLHTAMNQPSFLETNPYVDLVVIGEYELSLLEICNTLQNSGELTAIPGILWRDVRGTIVVNQPREIIQDLDMLPWPDRDSLPMVNYCDTPGNIPRPSAQMWASRGCPFQCVFCAWPQIMYGGHQYRARKPQNVVDEMEWLIRERGFKSVYFDDDTFNIGKSRILEICAQINHRRLEVPWAIMARADTMDEEMLRALKAAGMSALKYGVESADQDLVDHSGKRLDIAQVQKIVVLTKQLGIFVHLTFTFGLPGETFESIDKTIRLALDLDPDSLQFSITTPFPGSKLYRELDAKGHIVSKNWAEYDGYNTAVIRTDTLTKSDLEDALQRAYRAWEKHRFLKGLKQEPGQALLRAVRNPTKAWLRLKRVLASLVKDGKH